jgi:peroxiredoxin Q/BCP
MAIKINKIAPSFNLPCDDETNIDLSELRGKNVVLYFYPKDDTPGCTIEAQDFSANIEAFKKLDTVVLGASKDSVKKHVKFIEKYNLQFNLISDEEKTLCESYEVLKEKSMFGKKYIGIDRSTFIIDKKGNLAKIYRSVKINGHVQEVLDFIKELEM